MRSEQAMAEAILRLSDAVGLLAYRFATANEIGTQTAADVISLTSQAAAFVTHLSVELESKQTADDTTDHG